MLEHNAFLISIELLAGSIWIGSLVCLSVVTNAARSSLDPAAQVAFFRALGRRYGIVGATSLAVALGIGLAMLWPPSSWGQLEVAAVSLSGLLAVVTGLGIRQARSMTRLRHQYLDHPDRGDLAHCVKRGATNAVIFRSAIAVFSLAVLIVVAVMLSD